MHGAIGGRSFREVGGGGGGLVNACNSILGV